MVTHFIERKLKEKSSTHRADLKRLGQACVDEPLSKSITILNQSTQVKGMNTIIQNRDTTPEDFIFYFDRIATLLIEQ